LGNAWGESWVSSLLASGIGKKNWLQFENGGKIYKIFILSTKLENKNRLNI